MCAFCAFCARIGCLGLDEIPKHRREVLSKMISYNNKETEKYFYNSTEAFNSETISDEVFDSAFVIFFSRNSSFLEISFLMLLFSCFAAFLWMNIVKNHY